MWNSIWSLLGWMLVYHTVALRATDKILTRQNSHGCMCFHPYPTGFCCQGSATSWFITLEDRVYSRLGSVLFLTHSPCGAFACSCWTPLQSTANLYSAVQGFAWWQMALRRGPRRVLSELCALASICGGRAGPLEGTATTTHSYGFWWTLCTNMYKYIYIFILFSGGGRSLVTLPALIRGI